MLSQYAVDHPTFRVIQRYFHLIVILEDCLAAGEPEQDLSGEIPIAGADETLTPPEIPAVPSGSTPSSSTSLPISPGASSSSGVKRTFRESTALPNSPGVSSGSGVKRAHGEGIVTDEDEQPRTRVRISALISRLHGVNAAWTRLPRSRRPHV